MKIQELEIKEKNTKSYSIECPFCKKEITGISKDQIIYNMEIHINAKHKRKNE